MASFDLAYDFMMDNEDAARACAIVPDAPAGAHAISGINSAAFPASYAAIAALVQDQREAAVYQFYKVKFWNSWFAQLQSDELAKRVFDESVNAGGETAVSLLQRALGPPVAVDGGWGPQTLAASNSADPDALVTAFISERVRYYEAIAARHSSDEKYLAEWLVRARK